MWEINGVRVLQDTPRQPVEPGTRRVRVWPNATEILSSLVPSPVEADWDRIDVESLELVAEPGHAYFLPARRDRFEVRSTVPEGGFQTSG